VVVGVLSAAENTSALTWQGEGRADDKAAGPPLAGFIT